LGWTTIFKEASTSTPPTKILISTGETLLLALVPVTVIT